MTAPLLATRDAIEAVLRTCRVDDDAPVRLLTDCDVHHVSHMLFASGVVRDPATLPDDAALVERVNFAGPRQLFSGAAPEEIRDVLTNLAAALAEDAS